MSDTKIPGGYILLSRKIIDSEIWRKPPLYLKIWIWLLERAQHKEFKKLKRGQLFTRIDEIQEGVSWYVGYRKETPTKDQVYQVIDWMRKLSERGNESNKEATMITTTKATHGLLVNIDKYDYYQNPKNYESNDESNNDSDAKETREQRQPDNINKNDKNDKNDKKKDIGDLINDYSQDEQLRTALYDFVRMRIKIKKPMTERAISLLLKELTSLSTDVRTQIAILDQSITHCWQTVYALKPQTPDKPAEIKQPKREIIRADEEFLKANGYK